MRLDLPDGAIDRIVDVLRQEPRVLRAVVFGSRAMGRARPASDIDIALWGAIDELALARLRGALDELPLPWVIDVVAMEHVQNAPLREHIDRVGIAILPTERASPHPIPSSGRLSRARNRDR